MVDEAHRLKNFNCRLIKELKMLTVCYGMDLGGEKGIERDRKG